MKSELAVPLEVNGRNPGGAQCGFGPDGRLYAEDQGLLEELAVQAAKVIHKTWLYEQLRLKVQLV